MRFRVPFSDFIAHEDTQHVRDLKAMKSIEVEADSEQEALAIVVRVLTELHEILDGVEVDEVKAEPPKPQRADP
jgi:hypothetical protein